MGAALWHTDQRLARIDALGKRVVLEFHLAAPKRVGLNPGRAMKHQHNDLEKRANPRPKLSDLRESGSLEQNADVVLMLHRPPRVEADALGCSEMELKNHPLAKCVDPREALICVPKQRRGWVGDIKADWFGEHQLFVFKDRKEDSDGTPRHVVDKDAITNPHPSPPCDP